MTYGLDDFTELLNAPGGAPESRNLFDPAREIFVARAPGRLDVMGGIADYSGSLVLQWPIREAAWSAVQLSDDRKIRIVSLGADESRAPSAAVPMSVLLKGDTPAEYAAVREYFSREPARHWAAYVAGTVCVLMRERGLPPASGLRILISSDVPEGKGVSSSAAVEVAAMQAVSRALGIEMDARETALLCQKVENLVVGAPCGVMDQMTSSAGQEGRFLALVCQPAEIAGFPPLPDELAVWGIDSGIRHSVSGADYGSVRAAAFMGYRLIATRAGSNRPSAWNGYLANITPSEFKQYYMNLLPPNMAGAAFLAEYGGVDDPVSVIQPGVRYAIRAAAAHPVYENFRVRLFAQLLREPFDEEKARLLGELMYQSHASYNDCGLGSPGTDRLVELARSAGPEQGLYGAKITGGGSGGTVAVLGRRGADDAVREIAQRYAQETRRSPHIFSGTSPGAAVFGVRRLRRIDEEWRPLD